MLLHGEPSPPKRAPPAPGARLCPRCLPSPLQTLWARPPHRAQTAPKSFGCFLHQCFPGSASIPSSSVPRCPSRSEARGAPKGCLKPWGARAPREPPSPSRTQPSRAHPARGQRFRAPGQLITKPPGHSARLKILPVPTPLPIALLGGDFVFRGCPNSASLLCVGRTLPPALTLLQTGPRRAERAQSPSTWLCREESSDPGLFY